jgi:uracil-DNA glycosylase family 4
MSLSRDQILDEMGLAPRWVLREPPAVARGAKRPAPLAPRPVTEALAPALANALVPDAADRHEQIARMDWDQLRRSIAACRSCALCAERRQALPGVGDENADWLFIGVAPGSDDDGQGEPFSGQAGELLDAMLAAIDLNRGQDVYLATAVKCRPPAGRAPDAAELAACAPYLERQIALLKPRLLVLLGDSAAHALLGDEGSPANPRGTTQSYRGGEREIPAVITCHPEYLLGTLPDKARSWEDLCRARALMRALKE